MGTGNQAEVAIIGAGIVGLAIGLELTTRFPGMTVAIIEKEQSVGRHQTSHNSGVIHSGIYYRPGSLKAELCVEGARSLLRFCREHGVPVNVCGKVIVATREEEVAGLAELHRRGEANGLRGLKTLTAAGIRDHEPHAAGICGLHVPETAIVDYGRVAEKYAELIGERGGSVHLGHEVTALRRSGRLTVVETTEGSISAGLVINCAGLHSDRVRRMTGQNGDARIVPFRGEYYEVAAEKQRLVKGLIYPVPDPQFPFLGVHFTRRIAGGVEAGPNAVLALKREGYAKNSFRMSDVLEYAAFPGFWKMASRHWQTSVKEYYRSWSKAAFARALQRLVPALTADDLVAGGSGVRAQALGADGKLIDDFHIAYTDLVVHVLNVPSPAATASLAIAKHIVDRVERDGALQVRVARPAAQPVH